MKRRRNSKRHYHLLDIELFVVDSVSHSLVWLLRKIREFFYHVMEKFNTKGKEGMGVMILRTFPYVLFFYFVEKGSWLYRHCRGNTAVEKTMTMVMNFQYAFRNPLPRLHPIDLAAGLVGAAILYTFILYRKSNAKNSSDECHLF